MKFQLSYDPMIAKLIVWDTDRSRALLRLQKALREYRLTGLTTNVDFLASFRRHPEFVNTNLTTEFIQQHQNPGTGQLSELSANCDGSCAVRYYSTPTAAWMQQQRPGKAVMPLE